MTATPILEHLASEFSLKPEHVSTVLDLIDAGLSAPYIGRVRRSDTGGLSESMIRRVERRRIVLEELDRRRGTILRMLESTEGVSPSVIDEIKRCMDRCEIEDLFIPHRRPEPEVQLALDRGLGLLADQMVASVRREAPTSEAPAESSTSTVEEQDASGEAPASAEETVQTEPESVESAEAVDSVAETPEPSAESDTAESNTSATDSTASATTVSETAAVEVAATDTAAPELDLAPDTSASVVAVAEETEAPAPAEAAPEAAPDSESKAQSSEPEPAASGATANRESKSTSKASKKAATPTGKHADRSGVLALKVELTPALARLCQPFVDPNKGVHSETEALAGATRILSDRVGRNAKLRGALRSMMRKQGVLSVKPTVNEKSVGRHRSLLKLNQPIRQVQGHKLLGIRQAQKERVLTTIITLDHGKALSRVRAQFGKRNHEDYDALLNAVSDRALRARLMPVIEEDIRLELKERGDDEALRLLTQHFRQMLLAPPGIRVSVAGLDVNAKGDWTIAVIDVDGNTTGKTGKIDTSDKDAGQLGKELAELLGDTDVRVIAMGHGKAARSGIEKVRTAVMIGELDVAVCIATEIGLSSYANSEIARKELADITIPFRSAVGLARRYKDPLTELLKVDPRHLRLGAEQALVSKANLRRAFREVIESCVAHAGCDVNTAPVSVLKHIPGIGHELAVKLVEKRVDQPFQSREELRAEGLLTEAQWTSAAAFLRVRGGPEPLDATSLHPVQYGLVRKLAEAGGGSVGDLLGRAGATKGLRRVDFDIDEATWRDLMREISYPGRDPRMRNLIPTLLSPDTDVSKLEKDQVVEGIVFNVASFGAFVDLGLSRDGMIHISEVSDRYVRDAREILSVGQTVRCRLLDASGQRIALSLKKVPYRDRAPARGGNRARGGRGREGGDKRFAQDRNREGSVRAAQTRRDGLGGARSSERKGGRGGGGGGRGPGGRRDSRGGPDEKFDRKLINPNSPNYTPFANFFKDDEEEKES